MLLCYFSPTKFNITGLTSILLRKSDNQRPLFNLIYSQTDNMKKLTVSNVNTITLLQTTHTTSALSSFFPKEIADIRLNSARAHWFLCGIKRSRDPFPLPHQKRSNKSPFQSYSIFDVKRFGNLIEGLLGTLRSRRSNRTFSYSSVTLRSRRWTNSQCDAHDAMLTTLAPA